MKGWGVLLGLWRKICGEADAPPAQEVPLKALRQPTLTRNHELMVRVILKKAHQRGMQDWGALAEYLSDIQDPHVALRALHQMRRWEVQEPERLKMCLGQVLQISTWEDNLRRLRWADAIPGAVPHQANKIPKVLSEVSSPSCFIVALPDAPGGLVFNTSAVEAADQKEGSALQACLQPQGTPHGQS